MEDNVLNIGDSTIIFCGGNPINDCPTDWKNAEEWAEKSNDNERDVKWSWDCGFKLDYDGSLVAVESRFYPPKTHYGPTWDGTVNIRVFGKDITKKEFDCTTLAELKTSVEAYIDEMRDKIIELLRPITE
jgi:hypothetical protein